MMFFIAPFFFRKNLAYLPEVDMSAEECKTVPDTACLPV